LVKADYAAGFGYLAGRAWWTVLDLLFPPRCANCQRVGDRLCVYCQREIEYITAPICIRCGYPLETHTPATETCDQCRRISFAGRGLRSAARHSGPARASVLALKYRHNRALAEPLADLMSRAWPADLPADALLMPVPLSLIRMRERGFNQAELLARGLGRRRGLPVAVGGLLRTRATRPQVGLNAVERRSNMTGAFAASGGTARRGAAIILIDDVCTTGATLSACAEALQQDGARDIWAYTLTRAVFADAENPI
jgi:ComF family protein